MVYSFWSVHPLGELSPAAAGGREREIVNDELAWKVS